MLTRAYWPLNGDLRFRQPLYECFLHIDGTLSTGGLRFDQIPLVRSIIGILREWGIASLHVERDLEHSFRMWLLGGRTLRHARLIRGPRRFPGLAEHDPVAEPGASSSDKEAGRAGYLKRVGVPRVLSVRGEPFDRWTHRGLRLFRHIVLRESWENVARSAGMPADRDTVRKSGYRDAAALGFRLPRLKGGRPLAVS